MNKNHQKSELSLKQYADHLGHWPSQNEWDQYARTHGLLSCTALRYHTGLNWETYRQHLGYLPKTRYYTQDDCIAALQQAEKSLGSFFTQREYNAWRKTQPDLPSRQQIITRCGRWNDAKTMAGFVPNPSFATKITTKEGCLEALRQAAAAKIKMPHTSKQYAGF